MHGWLAVQSLPFISVACLHAKATDLGQLPSSSPCNKRPSLLVQLLCGHVLAHMRPLQILFLAHTQIVYPYALACLLHPCGVSHAAQGSELCLRIQDIL